MENIIEHFQIWISRYIRQVIVVHPIASTHPCPAQPLRDPRHQHQQDVYPPNMSSDNSSILLTLGDNSPSPGQPLHRDNHQHTEKPQHVGAGTDATLPTPECSFGIIDWGNASLTALLQSTPHRPNSSDRNEQITRSTIVDRFVVCNLFDSVLKSSVDKFQSKCLLWRRIMRILRSGFVPSRHAITVMKIGTSRYVMSCMASGKTWTASAGQYKSLRHN